MMPVGPLMIEHRLIERMVGLMRREISRMKARQEVDVKFIDTALDFIRSYADRCHHGKEEDILFRDLSKKKLSPPDRKVMDELVEEHVRGRKMVGKLEEAKNAYAGGNKAALDDVVEYMVLLSEFYPRHILKEDKHFFIPCMEYFTREEQDRMLSEMMEFDRKLIHERYGKVVEDLSKGV